MPEVYPSERSMYDIEQNSRHLYQIGYSGNGEIDRIRRKFENDLGKIVEAAIRERIIEVFAIIEQKLQENSQSPKPRRTVKKTKEGKHPKSSATYSDRDNRTHKKHKAAVKWLPQSTLNAPTNGDSANGSSITESSQPVRLDAIVQGPDRNAAIEELTLAVAMAGVHSERGGSTDPDEIGALLKDPMQLLRKPPNLSGVPERIKSAEDGAPKKSESGIDGSRSSDAVVEPANNDEHTDAVPTMTTEPSSSQPITAEAGDGTASSVAFASKIDAVGFQPGIVYVINPGSALSRKYLGIEGEFKFVPFTDPVYEEMKGRLDPKPDEILFRGGNGCHFFINPLAVCKSSELETIREQIETRAATLKYPEKPEGKKRGRRKMKPAPLQSIAAQITTETTAAMPTDAPENSDQKDDEHATVDVPAKKRGRRKNVTATEDEAAQAEASRTAIQQLEGLKTKWDDIDYPARVKRIGEIYVIFSAGHRRITKFVNAASEILDCDYDEIREILEEYLIPASSGARSERKEGYEGRSSKRQGRRKAIKVEGIGKVSYINIEQEWPRLSWHERALALGLFFRIETDDVGRNEAFESLCSKVPFLGQNTIGGYLEISNLVILKKTENDKIFSQNTVSIIGDMRLRFVELFSITELYSVMWRAMNDKENLTADGYLLPKPVLDFKEDLVTRRQTIDNINPDAEYTIDRKTSFGKNYKGIWDEKLKLAPVTDPDYAVWLERLEPKPGHVLFKGSKSWFAIDPRAVCEASEIAESDSDFAFEDEDGSEEGDD
jgi:hypothetical protein